MQNKPTLFLLPNLLGHYLPAEVFLPASVFKVMHTLDGLIAESESEGRRYLKRFETKKNATETPIALFNEHTPVSHLDFLLEPIVAGEKWGLVSDAGLPCIADPGSKLVERARQRGIHIQAFVGPSSILLALMLSGLPGQKFCFQGYLDKDPKKRGEQLKHLMKQAKEEYATQIIIEAPYRNRHTLDTFLQELPEKARLCVAWDLTLPTQGVMTQTIAHWKKCTLPNLDKKPAIFLFHIVRSSGIGILKSGAAIN